jgi:PucR C-terminal helix-turn-helix domain
MRDLHAKMLASLLAGDVWVEPLVAHDDEYRTELAGTLEAYLANDCNMNATARAVFAHRHTVAHRLARVRELTGLDPSLGEDRERLGSASRPTGSSAQHSGGSRAETRHGAAEGVAAGVPPPPLPPPRPEGATARPPDRRLASSSRYAGKTRQASAGRLQIGLL